MATVEVGTEYGILLRGRKRDAHLADNVGILSEHAAQVARRDEVVDDDANRQAGAAALAGRTVGDRLAAAEPAMGEQVVEVARFLAHEVREHLALFTTG